MSSISQFISKSIEEMRTNVTWPTYQELQSNSILVLVSSLLFALVIWATDVVFENLMKLIYQSAS